MGDTAVSQIRFADLADSKSEVAFPTPLVGIQTKKEHFSAARATVINLTMPIFISDACGACGL